MKSSLTIDARSLGDTFTGDPEFALPERPRFIREVLVIPVGHDGLLFEGTRDTQVISGRSARTFIPRLLPHLDGHHTLQMLQARFPSLPPKSVRDAIVLLYTRGLLEDGPEGTPAEGLEHLASFAGRYADVTRVSASRQQILARLAAAKVAVIDSEAGRQVASALAGHGLARLDVLARPQQLRAGEADLLVAVFSGAAPEAAEWLAAAQAAGIRALHVHVGSDAVEVGPYIIPGASGCHDCMRALQAQPQGEVPADLEFWTGIAALQAINLIARFGPAKLYNTCRVHGRTEHGPSFNKTVLARLPGCPTCGLEGAQMERGNPDLRTWVLHQAAHVMTAKELRSPRDHQIHYAASNLQLTQKAPRPRFGAPIVELPAPEPLNLLPVWSGPTRQLARVDQELLGQLLRHAAGYQDVASRPRRIAASGGGLCSCNLYVVARRVPGLEPGVYHYFGHGHLLERVCHFEDSLLAGALGIADADLPPLLLVGASDMRKTRQKYDEFSFRIGVLDGGVARQYLQEIGDAAGVRIVEYADMRDKVMAHLMNLPTIGNRNMLLFAVGLGDVRVDGEAPDALRHHYQSPDALIEMCSRLGPARPQQALPALPWVAPHSPRPLGEMMLARRSHRRFANKPVPLRVLQSIAAIAADADARRRYTSGLDLKMKFWMVAERADEPGTRAVYRWDTEHRDLVLVRDGVTHDELLATMQQHGYAQAPVTCFVTGNFEAALQDLGPRGYRELASRASSMLARAQLSAANWNVVGSMWGGLAEEGVGRVLGIDRYRDCPMFSASFGYSPDA